MCFLCLSPTLAKAERKINFPQVSRVAEFSLVLKALRWQTQDAI